MTQKAVNAILSYGSAFSLGVGVLYLWVFTPDKYSFWPHYLLLSFFIFAFLAFVAVFISITDKYPIIYLSEKEKSSQEFKPSTRVITLWTALVVVMVSLYLFFS